MYLNLSVIPHIIDQIFVANKFMTVLRHYDLDNRKYVKTKGITVYKRYRTNIADAKYNHIQRAYFLSEYDRNEW